MTFKQVKDLLDIGFIPSIIMVPSSNNGNNSDSSEKKTADLLDDSTNSYITQIISYETWTGEYNEEEITTYKVKLANGNELYALNQNDELSSSLPIPGGGGTILR